MQQGNTKERIVEAYIELESERPLEKISMVLYQVGESSRRLRTSSIFSRG